MVFNVIGLGLADEKDVTVNGLEAIRRSTRVYLEAYTSVLLCPQEKLESFYGKTLIVADRNMVESSSDEILAGADKEDVSFLVVGDPLGATTHTDLLIRARELGIKSRVIHNASIMNACSACGLQLYSFGQTVSIPFFTDNWKPKSFYDRIAENAVSGMHTLLLLDIKVKEQSEENLARGREIFEPPRFMGIPCAISQLLESMPDSGSVYTKDTLAISLSRVGSVGQIIKAGTLEQLAELEESEFGAPLHSFVLVGDRVHPLELDYASEYAVDKAHWAKRMDDLNAKSPQDLKYFIMGILRDPGTDLGTLTIAGIRGILETIYDQALLEAHRKELKTLIKELYNEVTEEIAVKHEEAKPAQDYTEKASTSSLKESTRNANESTQSTPNVDVEDSESPKSVKKKPKKAKVKAEEPIETDEAMARRLQMQEHSRTTRRPQKATSSIAKKAKVKKNKQKSTAMVRESDDSDMVLSSDEEDEAKPKRKSGSGGAFNKEHLLSAALATLCKVDRCSRPQCVKKLWVYIRENGLQDPKDKRKIICDDNFKAYTGTNTSTMFHMNKVMSSHLYPIEDEQS